MYIYKHGSPPPPQGSAPLPVVIRDAADNGGLITHMGRWESSSWISSRRCTGWTGAVTARLLRGRQCCAPAHLTGCPVVCRTRVCWRGGPRSRPRGHAGHLLTHTRGPGRGRWMRWIKSATRDCHGRGLAVTLRWPKANTERHSLSRTLFPRRRTCILEVAL